MGVLVDIRDVSKIYNPGENEVRALDHVTVSIEEGEYVAIIGQSGSGKSTLMNILGCLDVPTEGTYFLHGNNVMELDDDELSDIRNQEIGFIFQGFNLIANLTAFENVELPLIYRGVGKGKRAQLAESALEKVGLGNRMDHRPSEMSGGQQQRVAIARAIAQAPPVILADEPTGNLDSHSTWEIMDILEALHEDGRTVIVITHNNEIAARAKRVIQIKDGRIEYDSKSSEKHEERQEASQELPEKMKIEVLPESSEQIKFEVSPEEQTTNQEELEALQERLEASLDEIEIQRDQLKENIQKVVASKEQQEEA